MATKINKNKAKERKEGLNCTQLQLLKMFSFAKTQKSLKELQSLLVKHYAAKIDDEIDSLFKKGVLTDEKVKSFGKEHLRTPYRK